MDRNGHLVPNGSEIPCRSRFWFCHRQCCCVCTAFTTAAAQWDERQHIAELGKGSERKFHFMCAAESCTTIRTVSSQFGIWDLDENITVFSCFSCSGFCRSCSKHKGVKACNEKQAHNRDTRHGARRVPPQSWFSRYNRNWNAAAWKG